MYTLYQLNNNTLGCTLSLESWMQKFAVIILILLLKIFLDEDLDCICCFEELGLNGVHIYQCPKGHVICPKCKQKLKCCPQCREDYGPVGIRNLILESIVAKLKPKSQIQKKPEQKMHDGKLLPRTRWHQQQQQQQQLQSRRQRQPPPTQPQRSAQPQNGLQVNR